MTVTRSIDLSTLRTRARQRSDMENSTFVSDSEFNNYINAAAAELYDMLVSAYGPEYWMKTATIPQTSGTSEYDLPTDFYKLLGVDADESSNGVAYSLLPFQFEQRNMYQEPNLMGGLIRARYRIKGAATPDGVSKLEILPNNTGIANINVHYIPLFSDMVADSDSVNGFNGWEEYIVLRAAFKALVKEESSTTQVERELENMEKRLEHIRTSRDVHGQEVIVDQMDYIRDWIY